jgi:hypothetical protein
MTKFEIRSPALLTAAALVLAPAFAFAGNEPNRASTTTTTTTTSPQGSPSINPQGSPQHDGSAATPPASRDMNAGVNSANSAGVSSAEMPSSDIDAAQVQKVFGMDVALIDLKSLNSEQIKVLQQRLSERGFYRGAIDGKMGPNTRNGIASLMAQQFALNQRLVNQGQITEQFASSLGVDTRGRVPVTGTDKMDQPSQHPEPRSNAPAPPPTVNQ